MSEWEPTMNLRFIGRETRTQIGMHQEFGPQWNVRNRTILQQQWHYTGWMSTAELMDGKEYEWRDVPLVEE